VVSGQLLVVSGQLLVEKMAKSNFENLQVYQLAEKLLIKFGISFFIGRSFLKQQLVSS